MKVLVTMAIRREGEGLNKKGRWKTHEGNKLLFSEAPRYFRPSKAKAKLGWTPKTTFEELVADMVCEDLKSAEPDDLINHHGYQAMDYCK